MVTDGNTQYSPKIVVERARQHQRRVDGQIRREATARNAEYFKRATTEASALEA
jgi:hypothetical protein